MSVNQVVLSGNLTSDPEPHTISDTLKVVNFSLAVEDKSAPNKEKTVSFLNGTAWNKTAEIIVEHFVKGSTLSFVGRVKQENYEDKKTGNKVSKVYFVVDQILNIPARNRSGNTNQSATVAQTQTRTKTPF